MTGCALAPAGQTPLGAEERLERDRDVLAHERDVALREIEDPQVRIGEVVRQQAEAGQDRRPPPALGVDVEDLDRERVARLGAAHGDRAGQRVDAIPVEPGDRARVGVRADLVVADVARPHDDGVARVDLEHGLVADVPREVHALVGEMMGPGHGSRL
jgi:hypothetical protein